MSTHTPAPWVLKIRTGMGEASQDVTVAEIEVNGKYRGGIAYMQSAEHIDGIGKDELIANARLIAAAPDMLEALNAARIALFNRDRNDLDEAAYAAVCAVIAKAEGRT
jgi:hypothetical protein